MEVHTTKISDADFTEEVLITERKTFSYRYIWNHFLKEKIQKYYLKYT